MKDNRINIEENMTNDEMAEIIFKYIADFVKNVADSDNTGYKNGLVETDKYILKIKQSIKRVVGEVSDEETLYIDYSNDDANEILDIKMSTDVFEDTKVYINYKITNSIDYIKANKKFIIGSGKNIFTEFRGGSN